MKKLLMIIASAILITGCHDYKADVEVLQKENQSLAEAGTYKDSTITSFMSSFNEIEANITSIEALKARVTENSSSPELKKTQVNRINEDIVLINDLMKANKEKIAALTKKLKASNFKVAGLEKTIAALNERLAEQDKQLAMLNEKLAAVNSTVEKLNTDVATLNTQSSDQKKIIDDQTTVMHTAYIATGTYKNLESKMVVIKKGGFLGVGKNKSVNPDFNNTAFQSVDITKTSSIALDTKGAEVLTNHPSDSYKLEHDARDKKEVTGLTITNPDRFWQLSKYLVVVTSK